MNLGFRHRHHSLSARLTWLYLGISVLFIVLVGGAIELTFIGSFKEHFRPHLVRYLEYINADIGSPPDIQRAKSIAARMPVEIHIYRKTGNWSSSDVVPKLDSIRIWKRFTENGVPYALGDLKDRQYLISWYPDYTLAFSLPHPRRHWHWRLMIPIIVLLMMLMILHHATRRLFAPITALKDGLQRIGHGELDHRVEVNRCDELGELADSINSMAGDIQQMLEAKRQLLLAISHELRSPLTRTKLLIEMLEDGKQRDELHHELDGMEQLIHELLETERLSGNHRALNKTRESLNRLISGVVDEYFGNDQVTAELPNEEILIEVDATRLKLLLRNLLENAVTHNRKDARPPRIRLTSLPDSIRIQVQDYGEGIAAEHLPHLMEPFYRVDPARQRQTGGYGLGLYLCRVIAEAHGGSLSIDSTPGSGTVLTLNLPA